VIAQELDPGTYLAIVRLSIADEVKLPTDTAARILSDGLLGGNYLALEPGGAEAMIEPGGEIAITQDPVNIADLLGRFVFGSAEDGKGGDAPAGP
jgi:phospholipid/cholesterol/gamma-HCH transport system substrate-binding protein